MLRSSVAEVGARAGGVNSGGGGGVVQRDWVTEMEKG
jgi:hypothetical protein